MACTRRHQPPAAPLLLWLALLALAEGPPRSHAVQGSHGAPLHALPVHAPGRPCQKVDLTAYDRSLGPEGAQTGFLYRDVQFHDKGDSLAVSMPPSCVQQITPRWPGGPIHFPHEVGLADRGGGGGGRLLEWWWLWHMGAPPRAHACGPVLLCGCKAGTVAGGWHHCGPLISGGCIC